MWLYGFLAAWIRGLLVLFCHRTEFGLYVDHIGNRRDQGKGEDRKVRGIVGGELGKGVEWTGVELSLGTTW